MSSYREVAELILKLKGELFLSPRERWFLKRLEESAYHWQLVEEGIKRFYAKLPPERRKKTPAFFALGEIERLKKKAIKNSAGKEDNWRERFKSLLEKLGEFIEVPKVEPKDKMSAEEILADLESKLYKHLWENLPEEEKKALLKKYAQFKQDKTALSFMIKGELRKKFGLGVFSLFVEER